MVQEILVQAQHSKLVDMLQSQQWDQVWRTHIKRTITLSDCFNHVNQSPTTSYQQFSSFSGYSPKELILYLLINPRPYVTGCQSLKQIFLQIQLPWFKTHWHFAVIFHLISLGQSFTAGINSYWQRCWSVSIAEEMVSFLLVMNCWFGLCWPGFLLPFGFPLLPQYLLIVLFLMSVSTEK